MRELGNCIFKLNTYTLFLKFAMYYKNCNTTKFDKKRQIEKVKEKLLHWCENNDIILVEYLYL